MASKLEAMASNLRAMASNLKGNFKIYQAGCHYHYLLVYLEQYCKTLAYWACSLLCFAEVIFKLFPCLHETPPYIHKCTVYVLLF